MKKIFMFTVFLILFFAGNSGAGPCDKHEYAELKDMDKKELNIAYCVARIDYEANMERQSLAMKAGLNPNVHGAETDARECSTEMDKARMAYKAKFHKEPTDCDELIKK